MKERKKWKSRNNEEGRIKYRKINNELRRATDKAKEKWWEEECKELEELDRKGRVDLVYDRVRQLTSSNAQKMRIKQGSPKIKDQNGNVITKVEEVWKRWREYIEWLYNKKEKPNMAQLEIESEINVEEDCKGPDLLDEEIRAAIKEIKNNKAVGVDEIPIEFWKVLGEKGVTELVGICKEMYEYGVWPEDFTKIILIPLPKKSNAMECEEYRTISLICHASKILLKVLTKRIEAKAKDYIGQNQFGFRKGCGTRDAIGVMRMLCERSLEHGSDVYMCFVDFEKAFDRVKWTKLMEILKMSNFEDQGQRSVLCRVIRKD